MRVSFLYLMAILRLDLHEILGINDATSLKY